MFVRNDCVKSCVLWGTPGVADKLIMITRKKDLRGGYPLWVKAAGSSVRVRRVLKHETCDIAVVGAGVS